MPPDMISQLKMAIDKLSKDHNDNKDKILTSIAENTNETKVIKGLLSDLRTRIEGMEEKKRQRSPNVRQIKVGAQQGPSGALTSKR